jgi:hypothetical protein
MRLLAISLAFGLLAVPLGARPALADAIDGHWCAGDGRRIQIEGPAIVTPGGRHLQGTYDRHHFSYVVPVPEAGAGHTVAMTLLGETVVRIQFGEAESELWKRCAPQLSLRVGSAFEPGTENA